MGSENDKRLDVEVDRLSSLPDDLIHRILSLNDTRDAVKTSALSSRWRLIWTAMTCLAFSSEDFPNLPKFSKFVENVLSRCKVQQLNITCLAESDIKFPLSLFSSQTLKHLILKQTDHHRGHILRGSVTLTSTWEVPALTTLHLDGIILSHDNTDNFSGLISKCVNLKNLTLTRCHLVGSNNIDFNIFHSQLSNLSINMEYWKVRLLSVVAPKLKNLMIRKYASTSSGIMISAPELAYLLLECYDIINFSAVDFNSLEKADISIKLPHLEVPQNIFDLFQLLHSVKDLTLNLEILEHLSHLSSSVDIISHQHSPLSNLESLKISPLLLYERQPPREIEVSTEVKNYLLGSSEGAAFTIVSRKEIIVERNATYAKKRMAELQVRLEQEKADIETNRAHTEQENVPMESHSALDENELQIEVNVEHINSCWESLDVQIKQGKKKIDGIVCVLRDIKKLMTKLPTSNRAEMQPCFSSLCAEADIVMSKIRDSMKIQLDENQSRLNVCFHELTETLQSSS